MNIFFNPDETKIGIDLPYDQVTIARIRSVPGARWLPAKKIWVVGKDMPTYQMLTEYFPGVEWDEKIHQWGYQFNLRVKNNTGLKNMEIKKQQVQDLGGDEYISKTQPRDHQLKALSLLHVNNNFALLMEMGTGKTKVVIDFLSTQKRKFGHVKALVVAPLSVVPNWAAEAVKHQDNLVVSLVIGDRAEKFAALNKEADIYVTNYAAMRTMVDSFAAMEWDAMICDESQNIKNRTSQQAKACYLVGKKAKRRYILTGTLVTNKPLDVFGQFKFLDESILGHNYYAFQSRYAIMRTVGKAQFAVAFRNIQGLSEKLAPWSYRVLKKDCLDLPEKIYETRHVDMSDEARRIYKELERELLAELGDGQYVSAPIILTKILRFSQLTSGFVKTASGEIKEVGNGKVKELLEILNESTGKCVVWVRFRHEMEMVKKGLDGEGVGYVSLSGDDAPEDRQKSIERFGVDDGVRVFIGQINAGGTGINLTAASTCVYMSNDFSLGVRAQSEDRLHRLGQLNKVTYIDLLCPGTIDETILKMIGQKKSLADIINADNINQRLEQIIHGQGNLGSGTKI